MSTILTFSVCKASRTDPKFGCSWKPKQPRKQSTGKGKLLELDVQVDKISLVDPTPLLHDIVRTLSFEVAFVIASR